MGASGAASVVGEANRRSLLLLLLLLLLHSESVRSPTALVRRVMDNDFLSGSKGGGDDGRADGGGKESEDGDCVIECECSVVRTTVSPPRSIGI